MSCLLTHAILWLLTTITNKMGRKVDQNIRKFSGLDKLLAWFSDFTMNDTFVYHYSCICVSTSFPP